MDKVYVRLLILSLSFLPACCFGQGSTQVQNCINTPGCVLPVGTYSITTTINVTRTFDFNHATLVPANSSGTMINMGTPNVIASNLVIAGTNATPSTNTVSGVAMNATNVSLQTSSISNIGGYGVVGGAFSNQSVNNCTITNTGNVGISFINNNGTVSGMQITNCTVDRTGQGAAVVQSAIMVRAQNGGAMTGSVITNNIFRMPPAPINPTGECFEIRNNTNALVSGNTNIGGTIGLSVVGGSFIHSPTGTYQNQSQYAVEQTNCLHTYTAGNIVGGAVGYLVDGSTTMQFDTIGTSSITGLTGLPVLVNMNFDAGLLIQNVTATTVTNGVSIKNATGVAISNCTFSGNSTTDGILLNQTIGGVTVTNTIFSGFSQKVFNIFANTAVTTNNVISQNVTITPGTTCYRTTGPVTIGANVSCSTLPAPPSLSYSGSPFTYYINSSITPLICTNSGGSSTSFSIVPVLPGSLLFNTSNGTISGNTTVLSPQTVYTVSAVNQGGQGSTQIKIAVINNPPQVFFSPSTQVDTLGRTSVVMTPRNNGGSATSWTISPSLPTGLSFNTSTGVISGTPSVLSSATNYTVTAFNSGGNSPVVVNISVVPPAPALPNVHYSPNSYVLPISVAIVPIVPISTGGAVSSWSINTPLPTGLNFDTSTGIVSGTPTVNSSTTTYTVTASNITGNFSTPLTFSVITVLPAPPSITYSPASVTLQINTPSPILIPINTGGVASSWSVSPSLPTGLTLNTSNGQISGTPTVLSPIATYTVTATNTGGSGNFGIGIGVVSPSPGVVIRVSTNPIVVP